MFNTRFRASPKEFVPNPDSTLHINAAYSDRSSRFVKRTVAIYAAFASLWVLVSDSAIGLLFSDPLVLSRVSVLKGWMFVLLTSILLYGLIRRMQIRSGKTAERNQARLQTILRTAADGIHILDRNGLLVEANASFLSMLGYDESAVGNLHVVDWDACDAWPAIRDRNDALIFAHERLVFETRHRRNDGTIIDVEINATGLELEGVWYLYAASRDITERKLAESAIIEAENRYRTILEWSPEPIGVHRDGRLLYVNAAAIKMFGAQSREQLLGIAVIDLVHPDFQATATSRVSKLLDGASENPMIEQQFLRIDGSVIDVEVQSTTIIYGKSPAILVAMRDITERIKSERMLRKLFAAIEQSPASIVITDLRACIEYVNPRFLEATGYRLEEAIGQNPRILQSGQVSMDTYRDLWSNLTSGNAWHGELINKRKSGEIYWEEAHIAPVKDSGGAIINYVSVKSDITQKKKEQAALHLALREKVALLNEVHHRVKNNLQVISSLLRLEAGRIPKPDAATVLNEMQGRVRSMALLHESLYRSGVFAQVDLGKFLAQLAAQAFRMSMASESNVRLELALDTINVALEKATPCALLVNELISNCLKHAFPDNTSGVVRVELCRIDEGRKARLTISDTGIGLGPDFELRRSQSLGLQLVSDLVGQIQGQLQVKSHNGASFEVTFSV